MDSLFCKIGSLRALLPAAPGRPCEGSCNASQAGQATPQSVRICACRSPASSSEELTIASSAPPPAEEATSKHGSFLPYFNPLPLLSAHSAIPTPLDFLWFNRKNQQTTERDRDPWAPGCAGDEQSMLFNDTETNERKGEKNHIESNVLRLLEKQEIFEISEVDVHGQENLSESKDFVHGLLKEALDELNANVNDGDMVNLEELKLDDVCYDLSCGTNSSDNLISTSSPLRRDGSWISRIKDFWPDPKTFKKQSTSTHAASQEPDGASFSSLRSDSEAACHTSQSSEAKENDVASNFNCAFGCSSEAPYTKVAHTKESFSKFLQNASLYDMKIFAQLAFLCDAAYMIPDIQPSQLMKYHHLRLVTSSLDKKAEAESKAKEDEASKKPSTSGKGKPILSVDNGGVKSNVEPSQFTLHSLSKSNPRQPSKAAHTKAADTKAVQIDASCLAEERQIISSSVLEHLEENKAVNEDSLMAVASVTATMLEEETKQAVAKDLQSSRSCPCEWFVCDEPSTYTRMFVIQGSESLASWQANLFFEPIKFEELDVFVHRGIYEAANAMYDQVFPEVLAHISTHGGLARARFTGHSLGGSLATLLALMFQIRGILPSTAILPVVTFGSPCIMCGGDYLLQKLKLPKNHIQSVMMHRDVVPRAFACDYPDHVAEVLKRLNGRFRDHPCLNNQKLLYAPMGQIFILQPNENAAPPHPLLPDGHGLYVLRHPMNGDDFENAIELWGAQRAFLNMPHPLDILSDPGAYGFDGAVSRDHDPQSYTKAINMVLKHEVKRLRRVQREHRRQFLWPLVLVESSSILQKGISSGVNLDHSKTTGDLTSSVSRTSRFFKQPVNYAINNRI